MSRKTHLKIALKCWVTGAVNRFWNVCTTNTIIANLHKQVIRNSHPPLISFLEQFEKRKDERRNCMRLPFATHTTTTHEITMCTIVNVIRSSNLISANAILLLFFYFIFGAKLMKWHSRNSRLEYFCGNVYWFEIRRPFHVRLPCTFSFFFLNKCHWPQSIICRETQNCLNAWAGATALFFIASSVVTMWHVCTDRTRDGPGTNVSLELYQ